MLAVVAEWKLHHDHRVCEFFSSSSPWSPVGMSRSNLPGATSIGTSPMKVSSTWETSSTFPLRSCPPPCAARPALRPQGPGPRVSSLISSECSLFYYKVPLEYRRIVFMEHASSAVDVKLLSGSIPDQRHRAVVQRSPPLMVLAEMTGAELFY